MIWDKFIFFVVDGDKTWKENMKYNSNPNEHLAHLECVKD
jgi:hypothetical protein